MLLVFYAVLNGLVNFNISNMFNNHFSFHGSYFGMNYSNITGFILLVSLIIQFFSGLLSSSYYEDYVVPRPDPAVYTMSDVNNG